MVRGGRGFASRPHFSSRIPSSPFKGEIRRGSWQDGNSGFNRPSPNSRPGGSFDNKYNSGRLTKAEEYLRHHRLDIDRGRHTPERKRPRIEASRHDSYGSSFSNSGRYDSISSERRMYSGGSSSSRGGGGGGGASSSSSAATAAGGGDREKVFSTSTSSTFPSPTRREFRRPFPPPSRSSTFRGRRLSSRHVVTSRRRSSSVSDTGASSRGKRLSESSYAIKKRNEIRPSERSSKIVKSKSHRHSQEKSSSSTEKPAASVEAQAKEKNENSTSVVKEKEKENGVQKEDKPVESKEESSATETKEKKEPEKSPRKEEKKRDAPENHERRKTGNPTVCPLCNIKMSNTVSYENHLKCRTHRKSLQKLAMNQRSILIQMRQVQRIAQNELEKNISSDKLSPATHFCPICKLNYKQPRSTHQASQSHKNIKHFLLPSCTLCDISFRSPLTYEMHLCSLSHLKRKQRAAASNSQLVEEVDLEDFTTIDSVCATDDKEPGTSDQSSNAADNDAVVGLENIRKIEAYYCDLCNRYLSRTPTDGDPDEILATHCKKRYHISSYLVSRKEKERKQRGSAKTTTTTVKTETDTETTSIEDKDKKKVEDSKEEKENSEKVSKVEDNQQPASETKAHEAESIETKQNDENADVEETNDTKDKNGTETKTITEDDKLWDGVDKDIGDLLVEADSMPSDGELEHDSDGDEENNGERYDRFKTDEKDKSDEKLATIQDDQIDEEIKEKEMEEH